MLASACTGPTASASTATAVATYSPTPAATGTSTALPASPTPADTAGPVASGTRLSTETPPPSDTPAPTETAPPDPVIIAAGDIASCRSEGDEATANLVEGIEGTVVTLGDAVYDRGTEQEFGRCYDPSWGRFKNRTRPAPGNHEYLTDSAAPYYKYFGEAAGEPGKGYYSFELGEWHIISLNSVCWEIGGCGEDAPQAVWLAADLAAQPAMCTLAYFHHPRFSSGPHGNLDAMQTLWDVLYAGGADLILNGHDHTYERFAPQNPQAAADPERGIRQFIAGTGGFTHYQISPTPQPNSEVRHTGTFGVLVLTLHAASYDWEFVPVAGETFTDSGSDECH
jgi:hypothetical protein